MQMKEQVANIMNDAIDVMNISIDIETNDNEEKDMTDYNYSSAYADIVHSINRNDIFGVYPLKENKESSSMFYITGADLVSLKSVPKNDHFSQYDFHLSPNIVDMYNEINSNKYLSKFTNLSIVSIKDLSVTYENSTAMQNIKTTMKNNIMLSMNGSNHYCGVLITDIDSLLLSPCIDAVKITTKFLYVGSARNDTTSYMEKVVDFLLKLAVIKRVYSSEQMSDLKSYLAGVNLESSDNSQCSNVYSGENFLAHSLCIMRFYQSKQVGDIIEFLKKLDYSTVGYHSFRIQIRLLILNIALAHMKHFNDLVSCDLKVVSQMTTAVQVSLKEQQTIGIIEPAKAIMDTLTDQGEVKAYGIVNGEFRMFLKNQNINYIDCLVKPGLSLYDQYPRPECERTKLHRYITFSATKIVERFYIARCQLIETKSGNRELVLMCVAQTFCGIRRFFVYDKHTENFMIFDETKIKNYKCDPNALVSIDYDGFIHYLKSTGVFYVGNKKRNSDLEESIDGPDLLNDGDFDSDDMKAEGGRDPQRLQMYLSNHGIQLRSDQGKKSSRTRVTPVVFTPIITKRPKKVAAPKQSKPRGSHAILDSVSVSGMDDSYQFTDKSGKSKIKNKKQSELPRFQPESQPMKRTRASKVTDKKELMQVIEDEENLNSEQKNGDNSGNFYSNDFFYNPTDTVEDSNKHSLTNNNHSGLLPQLNDKIQVGSNSNTSVGTNSISTSTSISSGCNTLNISAIEVNDNKLSNSEQIYKHMDIVEWLKYNGFSNNYANQIFAKMKDRNVDNLTRLTIRLKAMPIFLDTLGIDTDDVVDLKCLLNCVNDSQMEKNETTIIQKISSVASEASALNTLPTSNSSLKASICTSTSTKQEDSQRVSSNKKYSVTKALFRMNNQNAFQREYQENRIHHYAANNYGMNNYHHPWTNQDFQGKMQGYGAISHYNHMRQDNEDYSEHRYPSMRTNSNWIDIDRRDNNHEYRQESDRARTLLKVENEFLHYRLRQETRRYEDEDYLNKIRKLDK
jgi:hypothetical protein